MKNKLAEKYLDQSLRALIEVTAEDMAKLHANYEKEWRKSITKLASKIGYAKPSLAAEDIHEQAIADTYDTPRSWRDTLTKIALDRKIEWAKEDLERALNEINSQ